MSISNLMRDHVYTAIVIGSLLEGETTVVLGGYASHQGYAPWWAVTLLSFIVNFFWDQGYYALGRWRGNWLLSKFPRLRLATERLSPRIHRNSRWLIFSLRFMYGLRTIGPIALGIARVPWKQFLVFNAIGALVWAVLFSSLGYVFGKAISTIIGGVSHYEMQAALAILAGGDCVVHMESLSPCSISVKALADIALVRCTGTRNVHFFGPSDMTRQNTASLKIAIGQKTVPSIAFRRSSRFSP